MWKEFKQFVMRGNVLDMAVGIIVGTAFGAIARSLVSDVLMPPIGLLLGGVDFSNLYVVLKQGATPGPYASLAQAQEAGAVVISYGVFINTVINFLVVALATFVIVRLVSRLQREKPAPPPAPTTKECPYCLSTIPVKATRCAYCTSELPES